MLSEADNTNRGLNNSSYPTRTEFNNCFIIYLLFAKLFLEEAGHLYDPAFGISSIN